MATFTNLSKTNSNWINPASAGFDFFITTSVPDFILVGSSETDFLIWQEATSWDNLAKI